MATEVKHGAHPRFRVRLGRGWYRVTVTGHYTKVDGLTAAGVTHVRWNSNRRSKQQCELLGLRTAFLHWFMKQWLRTGGAWPAGVREVTGYPWRRLRRQLAPAQRHTRKGGRPRR